MSNYPGAKEALRDWVIHAQPTHAYYCEPFAGHGSVFRHKSPALFSLLIDLDYRVIDWWREQRPAACELRRCCALKWLAGDAQRLGGEWLLYLDPPYLPSSRRGGRIYRHELSIDQHAELLDAVDSLGCQVQLSGYRSRLYDQCLTGWRRLDKSVVDRRGRRRLESLWCNYGAEFSRPMATSYGSLGADYRERERVAKRVRRAAKNWAKCNNRCEREAVLRAILETEFQLRRAAP